MRVQNEIDRFHLVMDVIQRLPQLGNRGAYAHPADAATSWWSIRRYITEYGEDMPEVREWKWK